MNTTGRNSKILCLNNKAMQKSVVGGNGFFSVGSYVFFIEIKIGIDIFKTMSYNIYIILVANYHFTM